MKNDTWCCRAYLFLFLICLASSLYAQDAPHTTQLPNGKLLAEVPGQPRQVNNLPTAVALSPDGRYAVLLHSGFGSYTSDQKQSLSVLNLETNELTDFPDDRLAHEARQTYFIGLAFSLDGKHIFASMASLTDPLGKSGGEERLLVASHGSDEALLLNTSNGKIMHRFDLSTFRHIPASLPYTAVVTSDGKRGFVSLWNASSVAELDLATGRVVRFIALRKPASPLAGGSHPTALLLDRSNTRLFVA